MKIKSIQEINEKIKKGKAIIVTAEEIRAIPDISVSKALQTLDVVTTATFAPMCSSGISINFGHTTPGIRMEKLHLNNVPLYGGIAAVDAYLGATEESFNNKKYGGAHVIEAWGKGTDCYPKKHVKTIINKNTVNEIQKIESIVASIIILDEILAFTGNIKIIKIDKEKNNEIIISS